MPKVQFEIGDVIREIRRQKHWTIEHLAEAAGLNKATISALENRGNYHKHTLDLVAKALGLASAEGLFQHAAPPVATDPLRARLLAAYAALEPEAARRAAVNAVEQIAEVLAEKQLLLSELQQAHSELAEAQADLRALRLAAERRKNPKHRAS